MVIDKLYVEDFRGIHKLELDLQGKSAVLFGINGVGKSSVLAAVSLLYGNMINRLVRMRFKQSIKMEESDIKIGKASAHVKAEFRFGEEEQTYSYSRAVYRKRNPIILSKELDRIISHYRERYLPEDWVDEENNLIEMGAESNIPIFVNYGVNRLVIKTPLRIRKTEGYGQFAAFEKAIENQIAFSKLFEWFLEQELYETQRQKIDPGYEDISLKAVKKAMLVMLDGYRDVHITAKPYSMKVYRDGDALDILQLSDGEKCVLALFGDLARRLAIANPGLKDPLKGVGVVLIDEIELHMHTSWQRKVIRVLKDTFPNVQFIITTHSPQVIGESGQGFHVFSLYRTEDEIGCKRSEGYFGLDSNSVLEEAFHTDSSNRDVKEKVSRMYRCIEERDFERAEQCIREIDSLTQNRNADTIRGRMLIRKGKRVHAADKEKS